MADEQNINEILKARGFESVDKLLETFDSLKTDLGKHKVRSTELTEAQKELEALRQEKQAREDAEKSEQQKLLDKMKQIEADKTAAEQRALAATRNAMLERAISEHIPQVHEKMRPFAAEYMRTVLPAREWADSESLKAAITDSLAKFSETLPQEFKPVPNGEQAKRGSEGQPHKQLEPGFGWKAALGQK